jgi:hypothetical protein
MKNVFLRALVAAALLAPGVARAQTVGTLLGHVFDQSGSPLKGVRVVISSPTQIGGTKSTTTDSEGTFRLAGLTPGTFTVRVSAPSLKAIEQNNVKVLAASTVEIDLIMEVESVGEEVRVIEKAPTINTTQAAVGETFDLDFVNRLPVSTRDFQGVAALTPGVSDGGGGNPSIRGGASFNNTYTVDGFQTSDPVTHTFTENFTFDAMNQVQVRTAAFGAEHSDTLGGGINIVTKSGSNRFEGDATFTYQDQNLELFKDARDVGTNRLMVGDLSLGGPILKDRLWFYVSGRGVSNVATLPQDPIFGQHPSANVVGLTGTAKLTWQLGPRNKIDFSTRYETGDFNNLLQSPLVEAEAEARQYQGKRVFGVEWHSAASDQLLLVLRAGANQDTLNVEPQSCKWDPNCSAIPGVVDLASGIRRDNYTSQSRERRETFELSGSLEWFKDSRRFGSHDLKLGGSFEGVRWLTAETTPGDAVVRTLGSDPFSREETCANDPKNDSGNCHHNWLYTDLTGSKFLFYLTDAWKPTRYLTITPGVALHISRSRDDKNTIVTDTIAGTPHLEAVWDPTHDGRTAVRGSFNNYVDPGFLALSGFTSRQLFRKRCDWDAQAMAYIRNCRSSGGDSGGTVGLPCGPDGIALDGSPCSSKLRLPRVWEYTIGVEREILTGITLGADYIYRKFVHQWEDIETNAVWNSGGTGLDRAGNFKSGRSQFIFDLETPDESRRQYHAVTVVARKREGRIRMTTAYTWSRYMGTEDSNYATSFLDNPGQSHYYYGALPTDVRHDLRALVTYEVATWLSLGVIYQFQSGGPYNRLFLDPSYQTFSSFRAQRGYNPGGNLNPDDDAPLRLPDVSRLDVQARFSLMRLVKQPLELFVDVTNILGLRTTTGVFEQDGPFWGRQVSRLGPTSARLGVQYRFR